MQATVEIDAVPQSADPPQGPPQNLFPADLPPTLWEKLWPALLLLLTPFLFIGRMMIVLVLWSYAHTLGDKRIVINAKCPACGVRRRHKIVYSDTYHAVLHRCEVCTAEWGEKPIVATEQWVIARVPEKTERTWQ